MSGLTKRCAKQISGVLGCLDRVVIQGTLPTALGVCRELPKMRLEEDAETKEAERDGFTCGCDGDGEVLAV